MYLQRNVKTLAFDIIFALIVAVSAGTAAGYLGSLMVSRHMALVGDALSHVALPGLALGLIFDFNPFLGAFLFVAAAIITTWYIERITTLAVEAIVGVLFVFALAIGVLITPEPDLLEALFGDISAVTWIDAVVTSLISAGVILATRSIYSRMVISMISREMAVSHGIKVSQINLIFLLLVAVVVALGIREIGTLLVGAVVIVPAAAARTVSSSLKRYTFLSSAIGAASAFAGVYASGILKTPAGPLVVLTGTAIFLFLLAVEHSAVRKGSQSSALNR